MEPLAYLAYALGCISCHLLFGVLLRCLELPGSWNDVGVWSIVRAKSQHMLSRHVYKFPFRSLRQDISSVCSGCFVGYCDTTVDFWKYPLYTILLWNYAGNCLCRYLLL